VKERPILFSGAMVRALLDGRKTQTRRIVKHQPVYGDVAGTFASWMFKKRKANGYWLYPNAKSTVLSECPYGEQGDRLWVRETFFPCPESHGGGWHYKATEQNDFMPTMPWKPSIHMPRVASRITLEITGVRVERLQGISETDSLSEGIEASSEGFGIDSGRHFHAASGRQSYASLWDSLNAARGYGWDENPWVWVVEFRKIDAREANQKQAG
jgi:hypothetical protein